MNSILRIRIRVLVEEARQIAVLLKSLMAIGTGAQGAATGATTLKGALNQIAKQGGTSVKAAQKAVVDLGKTQVQTADASAAAWIKSYQKQTAALSDEMNKRAQLAAKEAAAQQKRFEDARNRTLSKDYTGQYAEYAKMLAAEDKERRASAARQAKEAQEQANRVRKINEGLRVDDARRVAQRLKDEQAVAQRIAKINQGLRADDARRAAQATKEAERAAANLRAINANLRKFEAQQAREREAAEKAANARIARDRVEAERRALAQINALWKSYKAGQMGDRNMLTGMEAYKNTSLPGSKVNLAAAGYIRKHKDETEALAAAQLRVAKNSDVARVATQRLSQAYERQRKSIIDVGKNVQWIGRQLEYNFTLPMFYAGRAVFDLAMETDKNVTKLVKVWGTGEEAVKGLTAEMVKLGIANGKLSANAPAVEQEGYKIGRSMSLLSQIFGVQIDKVAELEASWAATGLTGYDLARATELTLQAMVVGDIEDAAEAFNILNQAAAGYGITINELEPVLAAINTAENMTAAQFTDIAKVLARTASVARVMGVPLEELVGIATVLTPAFGSAETAGNGLKNILTRIMAPTDKARAMMQELGLSIDEGAWQSTNATGRLKILADAMSGLTQEQKAQVEATLFGLYQVNRASGVLEDYAKDVSEAERVENLLKVAREGNSETVAQYRKEIDQYLRSEYVSMNRAKAVLQDAAGKILAQLLPSILILASGLAMLAQKFAELDEGTRMFVVLGIVAIGLIGPVMRISGAFIQLVGVFGYLGKALLWVIGLFFGQAAAAKTAAAASLEAAAATNAATASSARSGIARLLTNPWLLLAAAIVAAVVAVWYFRDELAPVFKYIHDTAVRAFNALPASIQNALIAVVTVVKNAALAVYKWLSYINPFAKHSPSLVDQVVAGVDLIARKYGSLANIGAIFRKAAGDLAAFKAAAAGAMAAGENAERAKTRESVAETSPDALPALDNLYGSLDSLRAGLDLIRSAMDGQEAVVNDLQRQYDALSDSIDLANDELDRQRDIASALKDQLDAAKDEADKWANAPIQGMKAYTDAIFDNELEQKKLRLAMMDIEDAVGPIDELREKMANLQGEVEQLRAMQSNLRKAGAGSEITGPIEDQIRALEAQRESFEDQVAPLEDLQDQLDALRRAGERLDLEEAIKFDPLRKQIDDAANAVEEFPFDVIMGGLIDAQKRVMDLTDAYEVQQGKVKDQEAVVKNLEDARKTLGTTLDAEKLKLDELKTAYDSYEQQVRDVEAAIRDLSSAAQDAAAGAADAAGDSLLGTGAGDFEPGDVPLPMPEGGGDFDAWLAENQKKLEDLLGGMNPFAAIQAKWEQFKGWWHSNVDFTNLMSELGRGWDATVVAFGAFVDWLKNLWGGLTSDPMWDVFVDIFRSMGETAGRYWDAIKSGATRLTDVIKDKFGSWGDILRPLGRFFGILGDALVALGRVVAAVVGGILLVFTWMADMLLPFLKTTWEFIVNIIGGAIDIIHGIILLVLGLITGDWQAAWDGIVYILRGAWDIIDGIIRFALGLLDAKWELLKDVAGKAWDWVLSKIVGIGWEIVKFLGGLGLKLIEAIGDPGRDIWNAVSGGFTWFYDRVSEIINGIGDFFRGIPDVVTEVAPKVYNAALDLGGKILGGIGDAVKGVWTWAGDIIGNIKNGLIGAINDLIGQLESKINSAMDAVSLPGWLNPLGGKVTLPHISIPRLHDGGIVPGIVGREVPTILQAGEGVLSIDQMDALARLFQGSVNTMEAPALTGPTGEARIVNVYGDLSFPNIHDGNDAEDFISNLEALAVN